MTQEQFNEAYDTLYNHAMSIREAKQPEYTMQNADVLINFKESEHHLRIVTGKQASRH